MLLGLLMASASCSLVAQSPPQTEPGLAMTWAGADGKAQPVDVVVVPNVWLYVPSGKSPSPFLPAGKFTATWSGQLSVELRSDYAFQAELNGELKLEINGVTVLEVTSDGNKTDASKTIRLNKGTNALTATFRNPTQGDAFVRLCWFNKETPRGPIPMTAFSHTGGSAALQRTEQLHLGRELFIEFRCAKCHALPASDPAIPELGMDAPSFEGIGSRRNYEWMARWILDPQMQRPTAHMPKILRGPAAKADAEAIAGFLAAQKGVLLPNDDNAPTAEQKEGGKRLFEILHCAACHNAPDMSESDTAKISLKHLRSKFAPGALSEFLLKPAAHYAWTRMPNFKLKPDEAKQLAAFLNSVADKPAEISAPNDSAIRERGKRLTQTTGCLNCHTLKLENQFKTKSLTDLPADKWQSGCLADKASDDSKSPLFAFTATGREALQAFAATDRASLARHVPAEFAERQSRLLDCRACHGQVEEIPPFDILGEKLKPEWMARFLAGEISYKPRPWLEARMPAFAERAEWLAQGLATQHGFPPQTPAEPAIDMDAAKVGQKLVSAAGGFSCVTCHSVGDFGADQAFETPGLDLAHSGERLRRSYFERWVRNPIQIDPASKMPVFFDENGKSPLTDFYDGDGPKTINAIWQYLRLGDKMPPPPMP